MGVLWRSDASGVAEVEVVSMQFRIIMSCLLVQHLHDSGVVNTPQNDNIMSLTNFINQTNHD
jgi:hypothetical protein